MNAPSPAPRRRLQAPRRFPLPSIRAPRTWSIRQKIIVLLLAPVIALIALWVFATSVTLGPALSLFDAKTSADRIAKPSEVVVTELQRERRVSLAYLGGGRRDRSELTAQRGHTDAAIASFRTSAGTAAARDSISEAGRARLDEFSTALDQLTLGRERVDQGLVDRMGALRQYTAVIDAAFRMYGDITVLSDEQLTSDARALTALGRAREVLSQEDALIAGAAAAGRLSAAEYTQIVQTIGTQRFLYAEAAPRLAADDRTAFEQLEREPALTQLRGYEDQLVAQGRAGAGLPIDESAWSSAYATAVERLRALELNATDGLVDRTTGVAGGILLRLGLAGILGLFAVVAAAIATFRGGRSLLVRLGGLRQAAQETADERLPEVMAKLRRGEEVDLATAAPPLPYGDDELGDVGRAFTELQRAAVASAVQEATLRKGLNEVFLNIARRSQTLLHRQLSLLDRMERRTTDPEELEDLFRVDHLATRMRRHAEDLVILAGAAPGRGWRTPVPLVDIVRGAVSEVEDYARVAIQSLPEASVLGRAVGDVIHLLAELLENATSFSPPHTRVTVSGQLVPHGLALEIEDRGLGMPVEAIEDANERLSHPPDFDPTSSARLGLFVVARLAARHSVRVQLRTSAYGGITAVALIPAELVVAELGRPDGPPALVAAPESDTARVAREATRELTPVQRPAIGAGPASPPPGPAIGVATRPPSHLPTAEPPNPSTESAMPASAPDALEPQLPRRVRQASLAPQLREPAPSQAGPDAPGDGQPRTPEEIRAMMSSFQAGTVRGRRDAERDEPGANGHRGHPDGERDRKW